MATLMRVAIFLLCCRVGLVAGLDPDVGKSMAELVSSKGYDIEQHFPVTDDGYILGMFRMPRAHGEAPSTKKKPVVLLQHALLDSSFAYVCQAFPNQSLGYILADAGYDVWLGNNRGNTYSTNHTTLRTDSDAFWNFTYDEMAFYDLPTQINYVLNVTGAETLSYVGHSQGTIQAFAGFSSLPELAARINVFVALAPVAHVYHQRGLLLSIVARLHVDELFRWLGFKNFLTGSFLKHFAPSLCRFAPSGCDDFIELIVGPSRNLNKTRIPVYVDATPAGTSVKNMVHWGQDVRADVFRMYNEGSSQANMWKYGQPEPPAYNLSNLHVPTVLFAGGKDYLADPADVDQISSGLPPGALLKRVDIDSYAHLDFTWGANANDLVYKHLMTFLPGAGHA